MPLSLRQTSLPARISTWALDDWLLTNYNSNMNINSRYTIGRTTFVPVAGYCNSNYCMVRTQRAGITTYSIINQRTGEFLNSGVTRDHAVKVWNRTGIYGLPPMHKSA